MNKNCIKIVGKAVRRIPCVSLLLTVAAVIIHFSYSLRIQLLYDRSALVHQELWRLITCHWGHLSTDHLFWSAATFFVLGSLCEIMDPKRYYATVAISAISIPIVIWWEDALDFSLEFSRLNPAEPLLDSGTKSEELVSYSFRKPNNLPEI